MSKFVPILEPASDRRWIDEPPRIGHAWAGSGDFTACDKQIIGDGWIVRAAVSWTADLSDKYLRCPDCMVALAGD